MTNAAELRNLFLNFFAENGHEIVSSSPLVPHNDPTLMFTNAGMVQFKNVFTGMENRPYKRAASSQKCVRAGGKHNDLDNVGYTARHHTFFEMLGNFSFGDYFKEDAIAFAWDFLTGWLKLPKDRLFITVYHTDDEAFNIWRKVTGFGEDKIFRISTNDNFWQMGDTGPCGPCSEIYYNFKNEPPVDITNAGDDCIEIWNLVFMQYEQFEDGTRKPLPKPSIDTGMGLERVAAILKGSNNNFETDIFKSIIAASVEKTGVAADGVHAASHRVIADHLRATSFLIADGVMPSNDGRGYVLRRIMRRAMRHAHHLGAREPLIFKLLPTLISVMGEAYPELVRAEALIRETIKMEEGRFLKTLERGLKILDESVSIMGDSSTLAGDVAFKLYDTYGFPLDLTADILRGKGKDVDNAGFESAMQKQKDEARKAWSGSGEKSTDSLWFGLRDRHGATEFLGYSVEKNEAVVLAIVKDGVEVQSANAGDKISFITNQTSFYGESGGQVGDVGVVRSGAFLAEITNTTKPISDMHVHHAQVGAGALKVGDSIELEVNHAVRLAIRANHSATHILHKALRNILGSHVTQKGSMVSAERLRFDFSHNKALTKQELEQIEDEVNAIIRQNGHVFTRVMSSDDAVKAGAMALFGEKYGDEVRVVNMGIEGAEHYSLELCGGTHVHHTGDIALLRIVGESSVAAGIRRIEALTAAAALDDIRKIDDALDDIAGVLKASRTEAAERVSILLQEKRKLEQQVAELKKQVAMGGGGNSTASDEIEKIGEFNFIGKVLNDFPAKDLRGLVDELKVKLGSGIVAVITCEDGKASVVTGVTQDISARISAVELAQIAAGVLGGKGGGGRPDMAQAGGPEAGNANDAINALKSRISA